MHTMISSFIGRILVEGTNPPPNEKEKKMKKHRRNQDIDVLVPLIHTRYDFYNLFLHYFFFAPTAANIHFA